MNLKNILILLALFLTINISVYIYTDLGSKDRINIVLKEDIKDLETHFNILNLSQKERAQAISQSILENTDLVKFLSESYTATKQQNQINRDILYNQLKEKYKIIKEQGVLQIQFVNKNNISFLRVHKPTKFGDDLTDVREDYKIVNKTLKSISVFTQGRTAHGFRNVFPIFDKNNNHIGAMEISFSSEHYQWYLNNISKIHSHFLVDKKIFNSKAWERDGLVLKYNPSFENKNLLISLNKLYDEKRYKLNSTRLEPYRDMIDMKLSKGEKFNFYIKYNDIVQIVSFLPIKNISDKTVAWIASYTQSDIIQSTLKTKLMARTVFFLISILIIYFLIRQINSTLQLKKEKEKTDQKHFLLNEILNTTDNIMFISDLKDIKFSNDKFKSTMMISHTYEYNNESNHNMLNLFIESDGYLHKGLLKDNESFTHLYKSTKVSDRKVLILNENLEPTVYAISMKKLIGNGDYLVTLSDISKLEEELKVVENKVYIDGLTGVYNRNKFNELFKKELNKVKRYNEPLSIAIIDIDHFKSFNDTYGHLIGDEVLISMAKTVNNNTRDTDVFARWGGEEFIIMFINTPANKAKQVAESLKDKIEENEHHTAGKITASFGVTQYKDEDDIETIFKRCDEALYLAKENGRNRVEIL